MSPDEPPEAAPPDGHEDEGSMRDLVKNALGPTEPPSSRVLQGVQRKIRLRSRGKFYSDKWAVEKNPPINTYLITSLLMLFVLLAAYAVLRPLSGASLPVHNEPEPVNIGVPIRR
jgi:hypothetical protein